MNQNNKSDSKIEDEIKKNTGMTPDEIKNVVNNGDVSKIMKNIGEDNAKKIEKILSDKKSTMEILSTPKAQSLLKKFFGGK